MHVSMEPPEDPPYEFDRRAQKPSGQVEVGLVLHPVHGCDELDILLSRGC